MIGARSDAEQVRVGDDAEGFVVLDDAGLIVPLGDVVGHESSELGREVETRFEDVWVLLGESDAYFGPRVLVLPP